LELDKAFLDDLIKSQKKKYLKLNIFIHPKIFIELSKMVLSSTDKQVVNSYNGNKILLNTD
jgi:hypothetical protein